MAILRLAPVLPSDVPGLWSQVVGRVAQCGVETASITTPDQWLERIMSGEAQLWVVLKGQTIAGCVITEIYDTVRGKTCGMPITAADDMVSAIPVAMDMITRWAEQQGCKRWEGVGRQGWQRVLKPYGGRAIATVVEGRI
jgi:hypothetical protein